MSIVFKKNQRRVYIRVIQNLDFFQVSQTKEEASAVSVKRTVSLDFSLTKAVFKFQFSYRKTRNSAIG